MLVSLFLVGGSFFSGHRFVRGIGFLFLRYVCPYKLMWKFFEPYIDDEQMVHARGAGNPEPQSALPPYSPLPPPT